MANSLSKEGCQKHYDWLIQTSNSYFVEIAKSSTEYAKIYSTNYSIAATNFYTECLKEDVFLEHQFTDIQKFEIKKAA